jgi:hypothetical protein
MIRVILLLFPLSLFAEVVTTTNLISQDFTDGSWDNPVNSWHAPNDLAGWNGLTHSTSVVYENDALKSGFDMTTGAEIFHWYNNQTVHITQSVTLDDGSVISQTKSYLASRGTVHDVANTIIIGSNTSADYKLGMSILFEDTRGQVGHYSADVRDPYITLTYDNTPPVQLSSTEVQEISSVLEDLVIEEFKLEDLKVFDVPVMDVKVEETPYFEDLTIEFEEELVVFKPEPMPIEEMSVETIEPEFEEVMIIEEAPVMEAQEETMEITNANETSEEPRTSVSTGEGETRGRDNAPTQTASTETSQVLGLVDNIQDVVSVKIPRVADQLKAVQYLVAKAMQSTNGLLKEYTNVNNSLFDNQPTIDGGNLDVYTSISYVDIRDIYPNNNYPDREVIWTSR